MGFWMLPDKILLPAEPDYPSAFRYNGRLPCGDQVMAYKGMPWSNHSTGTRQPIRWIAVLFRFDADGVLRSCDFASTGFSEDSSKESMSRTEQQAKMLLLQLVEKVMAEGWVSADIVVRPFHVCLDGYVTGLIYRTSGEDEGEESEDSPEEMRLIPFDKIFYRPWNDGCYST